VVRFDSMIVELIHERSFHGAYVKRVRLICPAYWHQVWNLITLSKNSRAPINQHISRV
jgi:hypothetical protein